MSRPTADTDTALAPPGNGNSGVFARMATRTLTVCAITSAGFHLWTAGAGPLPGFKQTSVHVLFAVLVCLLNRAAATGARRPTGRVAGRLDEGIVVAECVVVLLGTGYVWREFDRLVNELGYARPTTLDIVVGVLMIGVVFDAARRAMGWAFPVIGVVVIAYTVFGDKVPGVLGHSGFDFSTAIANSFSSPLGIYGSVTATSATQIAIFVIFGALLMRLGGGEGFLKLALVAAGRLRGGPGKVSVLSSALFGMVNGSAVANTASTGVITIPMMKRYGFSSRFAAAVESTASTGGQWTPPIMGAAVFLMAQLLGMPYYSVVLAAIIPACIYYLSFWVTVHAEASARGLEGLPRDEIPRVRDFVDELVILIPAVGALLWLILMAYPVRMAGFAATTVLLISAGIVQLLWKRRRLVDFLADVVKGCRDGAITVATIGVLVAGSQVVVAGVGTTGVALNVGSMIFSVASVSVIVALVLAAVINIVLGLALPTVPSYLIAVAITGAALQELGISALGVHMFALYFAVIGGLTPPIGATVFVAAAIARTGWLRTSLTALRLCGMGIALPFVFVLRPELLLDGDPMRIATATAVVAAGSVLLAMGLARYSIRPLKWWEAGALCALAVTLFYPLPLMDAVGIAAAAGMALWWWVIRRRQATEARADLASAHASAELKSVRS